MYIVLCVCFFFFCLDFFLSTAFVQRCEAAVIAGKEMCKARATHGDVGEGATACDLHKTDSMVRLHLHAACQNLPDTVLILE